MIQVYYIHVGVGAVGVTDQPVTCGMGVYLGDAWMGLGRTAYCDLSKHGIFIQESEMIQHIAQAGSSLDTGTLFVYWRESLTRTSNLHVALYWTSEVVLDWEPESFETGGPSDLPKIWPTVLNGPSIWDHLRNDV